MPLDKCVILARGLGTRMRAGDGEAALDAGQAAAAGAGLKAMIPVGRPFLDYVLSALADAGFARVGLVIGPEHTQVREYYGGSHRPRRLVVEFAIQPEPRGTADALLAAREFSGGDEFISINGDNYYPVDVLRQLRTLEGPGTVLFEADALVRESNIPRERIDDFADAVVDDRGFLVDLIEKPGRRNPERRQAALPGPLTECDAGLSAAVEASGNRRSLARKRSNAPSMRPRLVSMNCWRFGPDIFRFCRDVPLSPRGEYELPLAVKLAIEDGVELRAVVTRGGVLDLSRRSDIAAVAERLANVKVDV